MKKISPFSKAECFVILFLSAFILFPCLLSAQNVAVSDDDSYTADPSSMLDVKSLTKGMLVPRMTTEQRAAISSPAQGLLVFDTEIASFFFYNGTAWVNLSSAGAEVWKLNGSDVVLSNNDRDVGIGTSNPVGKLEVKGDAQIGINEPLFSVINTSGDTVLAVYSEGVRIYVKDMPGKGSGSKGGFAVGGFSPSKGITNEFLRITPDSIRMYVDTSSSQKGSGSKGGFAVGGFSPSKGILDDHYLLITSDSSRVNVDGDGGFSISNIETGSAQNFMDLTPENYFIGHESGMSITTGLHNSCLGYNAGKLLSTGIENVFLGYQSGLSNTSGYRNAFIGYMAGKSNKDGYWNVFIGTNAGTSNTSGESNIFIGSNAGYNNKTGFQNIFMGSDAGYECNASGNIYIGEASGRNNTIGYNNIVLGANAGTVSGGLNNIFLGRNSGASCSGQKNVFIGHYTDMDNANSGENNVIIGYEAGKKAQGSGNVFIGYQAGYYVGTSDKLFIDNTNTDYPLIWGDFSTRKVVINGNSSDNPTNFTFYVNGTAGGDLAWNSTSDFRLKKNISTIQDPLTKVMALRGVNFEWKDENSPEKGKRMGFIAQEVEPVIPEVVNNSNETYSMQYAPVTALLVEAIKEQQKMIAALKDENAELRKQNETLNIKIDNENRLLKAEIENLKSVFQGK